MTVEFSYTLKVTDSFIHSHTQLKENFLPNWNALGGFKTNADEEIREFTGLLGYYRKFNSAQITKPLNNVSIKGEKWIFKIPFILKILKHLNFFPTCYVFQSKRNNVTKVEPKIKMSSKYHFVFGRFKSIVSMTV